MSLRLEIDRAAAALESSGVPSPRADAVLLAAHVLGVDRGEVERRLLLGWTPDEGFLDGYAGLVEERAARIPLQHLTGRAGFRHLELAVGPGVFVPRPETELLVDLVLADVCLSAGREGSGATVGHTSAKGDGVVVDLCTGSGAIALAVADESPGTRVVAVEVSAEAIAWARHNVERTGLGVEVVAADATADPRTVMELADLVGKVDVVVSNPPYIPTEMVPVDPEVAEHDPQIALYGGSADGLAIPLAVARTAAHLLRPGGLLVMEHADTQGESLPAALRRTPEWTDVRDVDDLTGRPRAVVARRA